MNCAYHGQNAAAVNCNGCGKPLCPACDHRVKGFPFCQDCIVSGVELLKNYNQSSYEPVIKRQTSPLVAALLSLICPGLGAAYNGQTVKALIYFAVFVGFFQMALMSSAMPIFVLGFLGMWLFAALDSYRTAQLLRSGITPDAAKDYIAQRFSGNPKLWGIVLTVLGASFFLQAVFNIRFLMRAILPMLLVGLGIYLLRDFVFKPKVAENDQPVFAGEKGAAAFSGASANASFQTDNFDSQNNFADEKSARTWKKG
jgi:TM2 domain-containing membrane protein YozV